MIETLRSDYVQMARLNGLPERRVVWRYALRNALAPAVQVFAQNIQYLIGGIIIVEYLFAYPARQGARRRGRDPRRARGAVDRDPDRGLRTSSSTSSPTCSSCCSCRSCGPAMREPAALRAHARRRDRAAAHPARVVLLVALLGPYFAPHAARAADRPRRSSGPSARRAARHRLPRPRRAVARALGRPQRARAGRPRDAARLRAGLAIGLVAGYTRLAARPAADARRRRAARRSRRCSSCSCW